MGLTANFDELISALEELERKAQGNIATNALNKGAEVMLQGQKETVPKDTGALEESLDKGAIKGSGTKAKITIGIENASDREITYGYYQEYGTENMVGKKWMKQAWNKNIKETTEAIKESIIKDLTSK